MKLEAVHTFIMAVFTAVALWVGSSVSNLNENMAKVLSIIEAHDRRIEKLEQRIYE